MFFFGRCACSVLKNGFSRSSEQERRVCFLIRRLFAVRSNIWKNSGKTTTGLTIEKGSKIRLFSRAKYAIMIAAPYRRRFVCERHLKA